MPRLHFVLRGDARGSIILTNYGAIISTDNPIEFVAHKQNLARILIYIYEEIPKLKPNTKFLVLGENNAEIVMTWKELRKYWVALHGREFDYGDAKRMLKPAEVNH